MNSDIYPCHPPAQKKHPISESKRSWCNPQRIQLSRLRTQHEGQGHWNAALLYRNQELWHLLYEIFRYWLGKGRAPYYPAENCKHTVPSNVCGSRQRHIWLCYRGTPFLRGSLAIRRRTAPPRVQVHTQHLPISHQWVDVPISWLFQQNISCYGRFDGTFEQKFDVCFDNWIG